MVELAAVSAVGLVAAPDVKLFAACTVAWAAASAVACYKMSAVVDPAAGLTLTAVTLGCVNGAVDPNVVRMA